MLVDNSPNFALAVISTLVATPLKVYIALIILASASDIFGIRPVYAGNCINGNLPCTLS